MGDRICKLIIFIIDYLKTFFHFCAVKVSIDLITSYTTTKV